MSVAVLPDHHVNQIRQAQITTRCSDSVLADIYGVSRKTIWNIKTNKRYFNLPIPKVRGFTNYEVYVDGRVLSKKTNSFVSPTRLGKVRILNDKGRRVTVRVNDLIAKGLDL